MTTAKLFQNGRSQAIRLPKEFRFKGKEVYIKKFEDVIVIIPKDTPWSTMIKSLEVFTDDFMENREQPENQFREDI